LNLTHIGYPKEPGGYVDFKIQRFSDADLVTHSAQNAGSERMCV